MRRGAATAISPAHICPVSLQIRLDHLRDKVFKRYRRLPFEMQPRLASVALQEVHLGRSLQLVARHHMIAIIEAGIGKRQLTKISHAGRPTSRHNVIVRLLLLEHQPHRTDVIFRMSPIPFRLEIA
jgi:hypothetical protein